jgi:hypothetical protein
MILDEFKIYVQSLIDKTMGSHLSSNGQFFVHYKVGGAKELVALSSLSI